MGLFDFFSLKRKKKEEEVSFHEMISFVEGREFSSRLPDLTQKKVLEIAPLQKSFAPLFREKGAAVVTSLGSAKEQAMGGQEGGFVLSSWEHLPFLEASWDSVFLRLPLLPVLKGSKEKILREARRVVKEKGSIGWSDFHPFSLKNPSGGEGFEGCFKLFQEAGLTIDWVKESFFDGSLKKFFGEKQNGVFERLRKTPFLILFGLKKA